ncbi:MAG: hypothetical protein IAF38_16005 [Bacteroidia bacterium]|nr:hypothetical protein [Bacteroidia bacterium]
MKINQHNYQAYILDYFEGTLSAPEREELMGFLNAHPIYRKEFEEFENIGLNDTDEIFFSGKDELKKKVTLSDETLFDFTEGNQNEKERTEVKKIIAGNAVLEKELALWQKSKVSPDLSVVYPTKEKLKRRPIIVPLWKNVYLRAAAVLAIILGSGWIYFSSNQTENLTALAFKQAERSDFASFLTASINPDSIRKKENDNKSSHHTTNNSIQKNNLFVNASEKLRKQQEKLQKIRLEKDSADAAIAREIQKKKTEIYLQQQQDSLEKIAKNKFIKTDSFPNNAIVKNTADSLFKKELHGTWGPEETIPVAGKKTLKHKFLDVAVSCLRGLKKIGVKKAEGIKETDPANGNTDYTLVLGKYSYTTLR